MVQEVAVARRTQFSSCDECRKSRVACDASARGIAGNEEDDKDDSVSCSRCLTRGRQCTFNVRICASPPDLAWPPLPSTASHGR
jgi:hypothetical protein